MSASVFSQNLSADSILISQAEADTITVQLMRLQHLEQYTSLLELNVKDLKLVNVKQKQTITDQQLIIANDSIMLSDSRSIMAQKDKIIKDTESVCKIEKRQIRKRSLIGGSVSGAAFVTILYFAVKSLLP
jgi:hypothetical protein